VSGHGSRRTAGGQPVARDRRIGRDARNREPRQPGRREPALADIDDDRGRGETEALRAQRIRRKYQREMARILEQFDAVLTPAAVGTAPDLSSTGDPVMNSPWTLADVPIVTLPCAIGSNGLPLAVQLSAAPLQEGLLLSVAKAVEGVINFQERPKL
jgi:Asp-tRNA(Asn)/Glu-tRNA(Gln) amidotransferase A subunit family amidase